MGKRYKINPSPSTVPKSNFARPTKVDTLQRVSFNFLRLQERKKKFEYASCSAKYFKKLLERLRDLSSMDKMSLIKNKGRGLRFHKIDFKEARVSEDSFDILGEDIDEDAWQFQLSSNEHGRVHGYFIGNIFYVVWLDPKHELYPGK